MEITDRIKNALAAFRKTKNNGPDPNAFLKYGHRRMSSTWSTPEITDEDFYTGYGFAVINKRANRSVVLGKKFLFTDAKESIIKKANDSGESVIHPYIDLIRNSLEFSERDFWYDISTYLDLEGIYYLMAVRTVASNRVGNIQKFTLLNPYWVKPIVNSKGVLGGYVENNPHLGQRDIPKEMIIPMKLLNPFNPEKPYSLADAARDSQFTMKQANDFAREAIDGNLNAPGILSSAIELPDDQFDNFVARVKNHGRGEPLFANGAGTVAWENMQTDLDKAALDKINSINRDTLLAISGLSKTGVGVEESGTGREVSRTQKDDFTENAIMPQIENIIDSLNLDYRHYYQDQYKQNGYNISLDNPLETNRDAEQADVDIRDSQFELLKSLLASGYPYDVAAKYSKGLIDITAIGEAPEKPEPATPPQPPTPPAEDPPVEPSSYLEKVYNVFEGYPIPIVQYLYEKDKPRHEDLSTQIKPLSEKGSLIYSTEDELKTVKIKRIGKMKNFLIAIVDKNTYIKLGKFKQYADRAAILEILNKRYKNQPVAVKHKGLKRDLNKDFYEKLTSGVPQILDNIIKKYQDEEWFEQAFNDYREHVLGSTVEEIKLPGVVFNKFFKSSSDKLSSIVELPETHSHAIFDNQEQLDSSTSALLGSVQSAENTLLTYYLDQISEGYNSPHADIESFVNGLTLPFAVWFTVMFPIFASNRVVETAQQLDMKDVPVTVMTDDIKAMINDFARREATSHLGTIKGDIENALAIIRTQTSDPTEIKRMLQAAFIDIQKRRAPLVASNASNRIFAMSQYEADLQFLTRHNLLKKAYKQLFSSTGDPCPICTYLIAQTNSAPIPFTEAFASLGDSITAEGVSMKFNYESILAGNVHPNCHCYYKLIIHDDIDNSAEIEKEATEKHTQAVIETVKSEIAPLIEKMHDEKKASDETLETIATATNRLDAKITDVENQLDQLDKRTKEARQLKEDLLEANQLKIKLSEAEDYASKLERIIDGQE